jgi:phosphoglycolate phosphatase
MPLLIFDLDGTLIDSRLDLAHAVNATRAFMGLEPLQHATVFQYVGNGAAVLIERALGHLNSTENLERALPFFLGYYSEHKLDYTVLYPGVREALDAFLAAGEPMAVLTNKPVRISQAIVEELGLAGHFFEVYGGNSFEFKKPHPIGIEKLMAEAGRGLADTIMVGDSGVDVQTARNAQVRCCGVTYGFQPETFEVFPPDILVERLEDLAAYLYQPAF